MSAKKIFEWVITSPYSQNSNLWLSTGLLSFKGLLIRFTFLWKNKTLSLAISKLCAEMPWATKENSWVNLKFEGEKQHLSVE